MDDNTRTRKDGRKWDITWALRFFLCVFLFDTSTRPHGVRVYVIFNAHKRTVRHCTRLKDVWFKGLLVLRTYYRVLDISNIFVESNRVWFGIFRCYVCSYAFPHYNTMVSALYKGFA